MVYIIPTSFTVVDQILEVKVNITAGVINLIRQIAILFDRTYYTILLIYVLLPKLHTAGARNSTSIYF